MQSSERVEGFYPLSFALYLRISAKMEEELETDVGQRKGVILHRFADLVLESLFDSAFLVRHMHVLPVPVSRGIADLFFENLDQFLLHFIKIAPICFVLESVNDEGFRQTTSVQQTG